MFMENGYAQILGRIKETIIRGGENIEPAEVEEVLTKHPDIINVQVRAKFSVLETSLHVALICFFRRCMVLHVRD